MVKLEEIKSAWLKKSPILLFDSEDREGEVDIMIPSHLITPNIIAQMRISAGGLICCAVSNEFAENAELPFIADLYRIQKDSVLEKMVGHGLPYGAKSSFSVAVNHVDSFTGITDNDRALTISQVGNLAKDFVNDDSIDLKKQFSRTFRLPGHVPLLRGAQGLLENRQGHTELGLALCELLNLPPSITMCEMMDENSGNALSVQDAKLYAQEHNLLFISGEEVIKIWEGLQ